MSDSFQDTGQLVRAGSSAVAAGYAVQAGDCLVYGHPLDESTDALAVSLAATGENNFLDDIILDFDVNLTGADLFARNGGYVSHPFNDFIPDEGYFEEPGDHADEKETSVMLHYHPELVFMNQAGDGKAGGFRNSLLKSGKVWIPRRWDLISTDTGIGNPLKATAEKGRRYAEAVASSYAEFLRDFSEGDLYLR